MENFLFPVIKVKVIKVIKGFGGRIQCHPPRPLGILEVACFVLLIGLVGCNPKHRVVVEP